MEKNDNIEIRKIFDIIKNQKILIVCIIILFTFLGTIYSYKYAVPKYKSTVTLLLIPENTAITNSDLALNSGLITTYSGIAKNYKILNEVIHNLNLDITEEELSKKISVNVITDTYIIQISVTDKNNNNALIIAKEVSNVFLNEIKEIYNLNNIGIVDEPELSETPYNTNHIKDIIMFFGFGVIMSLVVIAAIYIIDNTIKEESELENYVKIKSLGNIPRYLNKKYEIAIKDDPKSYIVESLNTIRTNIFYMNSTKRAKTILITSCIPAEGKSWVSSNLSVSFASINKKVLLIDADLRKGRTNKIFNIENKEGLSNYLFNMTGFIYEDIELAKKYIKETDIPNLHILPNGTVPPNPSELLGSNNMKELIEICKSIYDIIIIDAPPCKPVTDSIVLSTITDSVVLVIKSASTRISDIKSVVKSIKNVDGQIIGGIINNTKPKEKTYKKGYYYGHEEIEQIGPENNKIVTIDEVIEEAKPNLSEIEIQEFDINIQSEEQAKNQAENQNQIPTRTLINRDEKNIRQILNEQNKQTEKISEVASNVDLIKSNIDESVTKLISDNNDILKQEMKKNSSQLLDEQNRQLEKISEVASNVDLIKSNIDESVTKLISDNNDALKQVIEKNNNILTDSIGRLHTQMEQMKEKTEDTSLKITEDIMENVAKEIQQNNEKIERIVDENNIKMGTHVQSSNEEIKDMIKNNNIQITDIINGTQEEIRELENRNQLLEKMIDSYDRETKKKLEENSETIIDTVNKINKQIENSNIFITKMIESNNKELKEQILDMDYTKQIDVMKQSIDDLKEKYLKLICEISKNNENNENKKQKSDKTTVMQIDNTQINGEKIEELVYSLDEEIHFEDIEKLAVEIIKFPKGKR